VETEDEVRQIRWQSLAVAAYDQNNADRLRIIDKAVSI
jgi:hypothetical protein